jgi:hypothetical protein
MHAVVEGQEIDDECYLLLKETDSLKPNNEFKQWLHIWTISTDSRDAGHIHMHTQLPWVRLWDKPDLSVMKAAHHITDFVNFPISWVQLWYHLEEQIEACREARREGRNEIHGPYWMLLEKPTIASLANKMAEWKRRVSVEVYGSLSRKEQSSSNVLEIIRHQFFQSIEPLRVMSPQQELEDETARAAEERSDVVRVGNRVALGRPPRCR